MTLSYCIVTQTVSFTWTPAEAKEVSAEALAHIRQQWRDMIADVGGKLSDIKERIEDKVR